MIGGQLDGERPAEVHHRGLEPGVDREAGRGAVALDRAEVDDRAAAGRSQPRDGQLDGAEEPGEVGAGEGVPALGGRLLERLVERAAHDVDHDIDLAVASSTSA